ncbi:MAG: hypothetical protein ACKV2U_24695 [Bryobacteraceae bacterium]
MAQKILDVLTAEDSEFNFTSSGSQSPALGGSPIFRVHLDRDKDDPTFMEELGLVIASPSTPTEFSLDHDDGSPFEQFLSRETMDKIIFARKDASGQISEPAQTVWAAQAILGNKSDPAPSCGCSVGASAIKIHELRGPLDVREYDGGQLFLAVPEGEASPLNTTPGFPGFRYVFNKVLITPAADARRRFETGDTKFRDVFLPLLTEARRREIILRPVIFNDCRRDKETRIREKIRRLCAWLEQSTARKGSS